MLVGAWRVSPGFGGKSVSTSAQYMHAALELTQILHAHHHLLARIAALAKTDPVYQLQVYHLRNEGIDGLRVDVRDAATDVVGEQKSVVIAIFIFMMMSKMRSLSSCRWCPSAAELA